MSTPMEDATTKFKSFWERKEGKTGMLFLAGIIAGGLILLKNILPWIISLLQDGLKATFLLLALGAIGYILWDPKFRLIVSTAYKLLMRKITGLFIELDPIGILKNHLKTLATSIKEMDEQIGKLGGVRAGLREKIETYLQEYKDCMDAASYAQKKQDLKNAKAYALKAERRKDAATKLSVLLKRIESIYRVLSKMYENCIIVYNDTKDNIKMNENKWRATRAAHKAMRSAMAVLRGNTNESDLYDQTIEIMNDDLSAKVGEMERFLEISNSVLNDIDLQNDRFAENGLKKLEEWEKTADSWILGDEKMKLLDAAPESESITLPNGEIMTGSNAWANALKK